MNNEIIKFVNGDLQTVLFYFCGQTTKTSYLIRLQN